MVNVLLNYYNFDGEWAREKLTQYVRGKVLIIPLAFREWEINDEVSWQAIYGEGGEKHDNIMRPFYAYGIEPSDIKWLDYFDKSADHTAELAEADVLFFTGGMPEKAVARIDELGLRAAIQNFDGVVMGASAGAMLQLARYHVTPTRTTPSTACTTGWGLSAVLTSKCIFSTPNCRMPAPSVRQATWDCPSARCGMRAVYLWKATTS